MCPASIAASSEPASALVGTRVSQLPALGIRDSLSQWPLIMRAVKVPGALSTLEALKYEWSDLPPSSAVVDDMKKADRLAAPSMYVATALPSSSLPVSWVTASPCTLTSQSS